MLDDMKTLAKSMLPGGLQVPFKYWYSHLRGNVEAELRFLEYLIRPGERVIDVGGNRGLYAYKLWQLGAVVEVFEPNRDCAKVLRQWANRKPRIAVHEAALSSKDSTGELRIPIDEQGVEHDSSATLEQSPSSRFRTMSVQLRSLDSYGFGNVSLIKIDTEGHESAVLAGAAETLRSTRPVLLIEIEQRHSADPITKTFDMLAGVGYKGFFYHEKRLIDTDRFDQAQHQSAENFVSGGVYCNNFLFLPQQNMSERHTQLLARFS